MASSGGSSRLKDKALLVNPNQVGAASLLLLRMEKCLMKGNHYRSCM
jgi:hypothetical protein